LDEAADADQQASAMNEFALDTAPLLLALAQLLLGIGVLVVARFVKGWLSPYSTDRELTEKDNPAFGLALSGYYAAVVIVYIGVARSVAPMLALGLTFAAGLGLLLAWSDIEKK